MTEWNNHITDKLLEGAVETLKKYGVDPSSITIERVPGSFELIYASSQLAKRGYLDAVIAIGCVIKGDTPHFDYICQGATQGIAHINATADTPIIYGILTVNNEEQALERTVGKIGNKGKEFALSAIKMAEFSAKDVAELRKQTGCGMMDCKNALKDANGNPTAAQLPIEDDAIIEGSADGVTPKVSTLRFNLDLGADGRVANITEVDAIAFDLVATSAAINNAVALNTNQFIGVKLQLELAGGITVDIDEFISQE